MNRGVTIGEAARLCGVTVKAVRHYHRVGLLPEPERDWSGYRRYGSADLVRLVRIRTLTRCGMPLADVAAVLDLDDEAFATAVEGVGRRLDERLRELQEQRTLLRRLTAGDPALLPDDAVALLARLRGLDLPVDLVASMRESMVLAAAIAPDFLSAFVARLDRRLDDPEHNRLLAAAWEAADWDPDDPRLDDLARDMAANLLADPERLAPLHGADVAVGDARYRLIDDHGPEGRPAVAALSRLVEGHLRRAGLPVP